MHPPSQTRPELLAPAGDRDSLRAAVANGADAVYFGLSKYSARQRAANFTREELPEIIAHLHGHNVRGYVTLNTLIFSEELAEAADFVAAIARAGADAVIVQDLGLAHLIHRMAPTLPIHASTQMTLTEPRAIEFVRRLGVERVILARELTLADIERISRETSMSLEVFVHGALCMSYSGQCLASETLWGRSANRGLCGQACRLPYRLLVDGRPRDLGDKAYLLSTKDLAAHDLLARLVRAGVAGFKIEGRLKSANYVAAATQVYRAAIDAAIAGRPFSLEREGGLRLAQSYSRGFTQGFLDGVMHAELVHGRFPKSRGVRIGKVSGKTPGGVIVELGAPAADVRPGDGIVFDEGRPAEDEQGGRVYAIEKKGSRYLVLVFGRGDVNLAAVSVGSTVWKSDDPRLERELTQSYARDVVVRRVPLSIRVDARAGAPLRVRAADGAGNEAEAAWDHPLEKAEKRPLTLELLREQFGRLGDTPFELADVEIIGDDGKPAPTAPVMAPKSVLNDLRRQVVAALMDARERRARHAVEEPGALDAIRREISTRWPAAAADAGPPQLYVLVRSPEQLDAALGSTPCEAVIRPALVYCDFADPRLYPEAVRRAAAAGMPVGLAALRIYKPADDALRRALAECRPGAVLVRNLGSLSFFREHAPDLPLVGDFSLNVTNEITAAVLAEAGLARITPGYDCNWGQLAAMLRRFPPARFEAIIHAHMPMLYMEHCVAAANLGRPPGQSQARREESGCGRPCEGRRIELQDRIGARHPLVADARCGSTLFSAHVQSAIELVPEMLRAGLRHFRVELLRETADQTRVVLDVYGRVLAGTTEPAAALAELEAQNPSGVKRGTWDFE